MCEKFVDRLNPEEGSEVRLAFELLSSIIRDLAQEEFNQAIHNEDVTNLFLGLTGETLKQLPFAPGDHVIYDKKEYVIEKITKKGKVILSDETGQKIKVEIMALRPVRQAVMEDEDSIYSEDEDEDEDEGMIYLLCAAHEESDGEYEDLFLNSANMKHHRVEYTTNKKKAAQFKTAESAKSFAVCLRQELGQYTRLPKGYDILRPYGLERSKVAE